MKNIPTAVSWKWRRNFTDVYFDVSRVIALRSYREPIEPLTLGMRQTSKIRQDTDLVNSIPSNDDLIAIWAEAERVNLARRRRDQGLTPEERLAKFEEIQRRAWKVLEANPEGMARFIRRNRAKRRESNRMRLELQMRGIPMSGIPRD